MSAIGALHLVLLETLAFVLVASALASLGVRAAENRMAAWSPESRHRGWLVLAFAPVILSVAGVLATFLPSLIGLVWTEYDHCLVHPGTHIHLCLVHLPKTLGNLSSWLVLLLVLMVLSVRVGKAVGGLARASCLRSRLLALGVYDAERSAWVLPTKDPLCLSVGVLRPAIVVSEGLLGAVTREQLRAVLLHERSHATRNDTLVRLLARAATLFMWPSARKQALQALELAAEQSCDESAARAIGDRLAMAEVILKVERLLAPMPRGLVPIAISFGGTAVELRVSALLESPRTEHRSVAPIVVLACLLVALFAASDPLHHLTETLLGALTH
jgi:Zn-dependent protease with chaperone function